MIRNAQVIEIAGITKVTAPCVVTGKAYSVEVPTAEYNAWKGGMLIQRAMPNLSKDDREFLISGTSPEGWEKLWAEPIEEDDEPAS